MITTKILFDGDPGIDDTLAILLALQSEELDLLGISTVAGNVNMDQCTRNALNILEICHRENIPVARGNDKPLFKKYVSADFVHGRDGIGNINLPTPKIKPMLKPAVDFIIKTVKLYPNQVTIVATGPLTNIAEVIKKDSKSLKYISEIVIMGGAVLVPGNVTPYAEYNIWADAEAAKIVIESKLPITLVPLDVTMSFFLPSNELIKIEKFKTPITRLITQMLPFYIESNRKRGNIDGCYIHDALAMAYTIDKTLLKTKKMGINVEIDNDEKYGQTISSELKPTINVCLEVDSQRFLKLFIERLVK